MIITDYTKEECPHLNTSVEWYRIYNAIGTVNIKYEWVECDDCGAKF